MITLTVLTILLSVIAGIGAVVFKAVFAVIGITALSVLLVSGDIVLGVVLVVLIIRGTFKRKRKNKKK